MTATKKTGIPEVITDRFGCRHEVKLIKMTLADYLMMFDDIYESGTSYSLGFILPGGEVLDLDVEVHGTERYIMTYEKVKVDGREVGSFCEHDIEEFRKYSEFGLFHTYTMPVDGHEQPF